MRFRIHKEGIPYIIASVVLLAIVTPVLLVLFAGGVLLWLAIAVIAGLSILTLLIINFFRNPHFPISSDEKHILAPANGKVVVIEETEDPVYFKEKVLQISIFMSPLDVHVNRAPVAGQVQWLKYFPGKYLVAWHPKSSTDNEQTYIVMNGPAGPIGFKQIAGAVARRIKWYVQPGQELEQGGEFGFIRFGSRVDVLIPQAQAVEVNIELHQKTKAGRTVLATYK